VLDEEEYTSLPETVDKLNINDQICPEGICVVRSKRHLNYFVLYRRDMATKAQGKFNLSNLPKETCTSRTNFDNARWMMSAVRCEGG